MILETTFKTEEGEARVLDCFTMREGGEHDPHQQILRTIEGVKGTVELRSMSNPGWLWRIKPWIRKDIEGIFWSSVAAMG